MTRLLIRRFIRLCLVFGGFVAGLLTLAACSVNPVTGKREVLLVSASDEVSIGRQQYQPSQQAQGGLYVVDPDLNLYIQQVGKKLAAASDRPGLPYEFVVLNSDVPNAWALPGGKIAINRGLLVYLEDESQLAAVLGHEIIHAAARHGAQQMTTGTLLGVGTQIIGQASGGTEYGEIINTGAGITAAAWQARYGRDKELESDKYGMRIMSAVGYEPQGAVELQQTFVKLSEGQNQDWISGFFASHPPSQERVDANRKRAANLPGDTRNRAQYQRAISQIAKDKQAYELQQQAKQALQNGESKQALKLIGQAIDRQPKENSFWEVRGYALYQEGNKSEAVKSYSQAIQLNPEYFSSYFRRGALQLEMENFSSAEKDLLSSKGLLDTQATNFLLGEVSMKLNKPQAAVNYFQLVAQNGGELGQTATERLQQLGVSSAVNE